MSINVNALFDRLRDVVLSREEFNSNQEAIKGLMYYGNLMLHRNVPVIMTIMEIFGFIDRAESNHIREELEIKVCKAVAAAGKKYIVA